MNNRIDKQFVHLRRYIEAFGYLIRENHSHMRTLYLLVKDEKYVEKYPKWRTMPEMVSFLEGVLVGWEVILKKSMEENHGTDIQ